MHITFVCPEEEYLGIEYLSAVLKKRGHLTDLAYDPCLFYGAVITIPKLSDLLSYKKIIVKQIVKAKPDLIAFSVVSDRYGWACYLAEQIKARINTPIVFGGIHPTSVPEVVIKNKFVDFVIVGEGEDALSELVCAIERKGKEFPIPNVWYKKDGQIIRNELRPLISDLNRLPFPDKELFYGRELPYKYNRSYTLITGRGCPYTCSFCNNSFLKRLYENKGRYLRRRSPGNVIEELKIAKHKYKRTNIMFDDELFTYDLKWLKEFSALYKKEIGLPSFCWAHPATITEETVFYLKEISTNEVEMGVNTLNPRTQKEILNRITPEKQIKGAIDLLRANKMLITVDNIFGFPGEGMEDYINLLKFYNKTRPDRVYIFYLRYYPKTSIIDKSALSEERIKEIESDTDAKYFTYKGNTFNEMLSRLRIVAVLIYLAPKRLIDFVLDKKIFKLFPAVDSYAFEIFMSIVLAYFKKTNKFLTLRKRRYSYIYYMFKKIWLKLELR